MQRLNVGFGIWLGWVVFVVYGSLLPFDYQAMPLDKAIAAFRQIPFLRLGIESRADWVANGVLYVPVGLLTTRLLLALFGGRGAPIAVVLALAFGITLGVAVEFSQQFFPPRTVSQNDLIAESIGALLGALVAPWLSPWVARFRGMGSVGGRRLLIGLLEVYVVVYLLQAMFPFDLLLDAREWKEKLASPNWGWFMSDAARQRGWIAALFLAIEMLLTVPLGLLLAAWWPTRRNLFSQALALGLFVGLFVELGQLAIASGISQGASVLARGLGTALGWWCWRLWADEGGVIAIRRRLRRYSGLFALVYVWVLVAVNGWLTLTWHDLAWAAQEWSKVRLTPFYYHYFTTEAAAVFSLGSVALMYLPVAILGWARRWGQAATVVVAFAAATTIEVSKLFLAGLRPDPSNPLIALAACWIGLCLIAVLERPPKPQLTASAATGHDAVVSVGPRNRDSSNIGPRLVMMLAALMLVAISVLLFPSQRLLILAVLFVSALVVWIRPVYALALVPAALPVFDLAPWTGRFFWTEFDMLLLLLFAISWFRTPPVSHRPGTGLLRILHLTLWLLGISLAASTVRGMLPWQWPDANSFNNYYSSFNALRMVKGAIWAFAFAALYRRIGISNIDKFKVFALGTSAGLTMAVAVILWERAAFVGLFDFAADYRVTGPFSVMHTGGAYIEVYLAVAAAFLMWLVVHTPGVLVRSLGAALLMVTSYALMVTYSRNGYAALLVVAIVMAGSVLIRGKDRVAVEVRWRARVFALLLVTLMGAASVPILLGTFAQQRLNQVQADFATRLAHWKDALYMRDKNWQTEVFGMGLGSYPAAHYWKSAESVKAASFGVATSKSGNFLRLGTGSQVYVEQMVDVHPGARYRMTLKLRSTAPATLGVALCEKWMLTSASCHSALIVARAAPGQWQLVEVSLSTEAWPSRQWFRARPVKLSLFSNAGPGVIEISDVRLEPENGSALLHNGDFSKGLDQWFFSADVDPPWHVHSLPVAVLFEQGWLGVLALVAVWAAAISLAVVRTLRADPIAPALLAALLAFTASGLFNTLIDAPRFLMLALFLVWLCGHSGTAQSARSRSAGPAATLLRR